MNINLRYSYIILLTVLFFILWGCEKEELSPISQETEKLKHIESSPKGKGELAFAPPKLKEKIKRLVIDKNGHHLSDLGKSDASEDFSKLLEDILKLPAIKVKTNDSNYDAYTYFIPTENPSILVNAIFSAEGDELTGGYVHVYRMTQNFALAFNSLSANFDEFEGELGIMPLASLHDLLYRRETKTEESDCFTYSFTLTPESPSGGSGGSGGIITGPGPSGTKPGNGGAGGSSYVCVEVYGEDTSTPGCDCGNPAELCCYGGHQVILIEVNCTTIQTFSDDNEVIKNKDLSVKECETLLSSVGVMPRDLNIPNTSEHTLEQIASATSQTCFNESAVLDIIDPVEFEACYDSGTTPPQCISDQVLEYLNGLDFPPLVIPGTPFNLNENLNFSSLSHEQQAIFLNAAVAANDNEHLMNGIATAFRAVSDPIVNENLSDIIFAYASLSANSSSVQQFLSSTNSLTNIYSVISEDITAAEISWLSNHPPTIIGINDLHFVIEYENTVSLIRDGLNDTEINSSEDFLTSMAERVFSERAGIPGPSEYDEDNDETVPSQRVRLDLDDNFLECFDEGPNDLDYLLNDSESFNNLKLTIYAEQPVPGQRTSYGPKSEWGHSFVTLSATPLMSDENGGDPIPGDEIHITFGFYPREDMSGQPFATVQSEILDNSRHKYHVAVEFEISQNQFNSAMEMAVSKASNNYDIEDYNCTDYVIDIANSLNTVSIPYTNSDYTFFSITVGAGRNPGDLAEDMKNLPIGNLIDVTQNPQAGRSSTCP